MEPPTTLSASQMLPSTRYSSGFTWGKSTVSRIGRSIGEHHDQPVHTDPEATRGRHAVFHRDQVVLIHRMRLLVALGPGLRLRLEANSLIHGIVELAERVAESPSPRRMARSAPPGEGWRLDRLAKRRELDRMIR